jgi:hypothetical protein
MMFLAVLITTSRSRTPSDLLWAGYRKLLRALGQRSDGGICYLSSQFKRVRLSGQMYAEPAIFWRVTEDCA